MTAENNDWATYTLKEAPYYREGMTMEEYDEEREYYAKNFTRIISGEMEYKPLWKQREESVA